MKNIKNYSQYIKEELFISDKEESMWKLNSMIDYTLLEESATKEDIIELCKKADQLGVKSVCVLPKMVKTAAKALEDSSVLVCTVISFPGGSDSLNSKIQETEFVIGQGADEVDMVISYKMLKEKGYDVYDTLVKEVGSLVDICHSEYDKNGHHIILKVIVESGLLTNEETKMATEICLEAGADFIKTSTGKVSIGAELVKIRIMRDIIKEAGSNMKIKASGGVRTLEDINKFKPYVDRFGMGYASVDKINNLTSDNKSEY